MEPDRTDGSLLEREREIARLEAALRDAADGRGRLVVVQGPAGIGKTALMRATCEAAEPHCLVLRARAGELEREFPHGVVRQLFEAPLRARTEAERDRLLQGAAALAAPAVAPGSVGTGPRGTADPSFAMTHGLYWLTANLADERPLVLAVDDVQWSDAGSLRFLVHLARRLEGLPVLVAACLRTGEPDTPEILLAELLGQPDAELLSPSPLSHAAVGRVLAECMGATAADEFVTACAEATGGTPFLLRELASALAAAGVRPTADSAGRVAEIGPQAVGRDVLRRLGRLPPPATELARAAAVLGVDARLHRALRLAGIAEAEAVVLVDALVTMNILHPGSPLEFVHPVVRAAVYDAIPGAARLAAHSRAADLLFDEGADLDAIATHLLLAEPAAKPGRAQLLRDAAAGALARGAAESAAIYLDRALEEGGITPNERAGLLLTRGRAQKALARDDAPPFLRRAYETTTDPVLRAEIAYDLADVHYYTGRWQEASTLAEAALAELGDRDPELALRIEALRSGQAFWDTRHLGDFLRRLPELRELAAVDSPAGRLIAMMLAAAAAWLGQPKEEVLRFVDLGWAGGRFVDEGGGESWAAPSLWHALALVEELDRALGTVEVALQDARARGTVWGVAMATPHRAWIHQRRGDLRAAAADVPASLEAPFYSGLWQTSSWYCVDVLLERPEFAEHAGAAASRAIDPALQNLVAWSTTHEARGRLRLGTGNLRGGIEDLEVCGGTVHAYGSPNGWGWRPALAVALAPADPERALELAGAELEAAERFGFPRAVGTALRTLGLVEGGQDGLRRLQQSVEVLDGSPAPLEHARSLVALGAAERRAGRRAAARDPLRTGLDLAHRCGASRLEARARAELTATGARPRRSLLTGRDALTPSEQRIAQMAAEGLSNPEIAQALFVTRKNVENHLGRIYAKLGIHSREHLDAALDREDPKTHHGGAAV